MTYWLILVIVALGQGGVVGAAIPSVALSSMHVGNFSTQKDCLAAGQEAMTAHVGASPGIHYHFLCVEASNGGASPPP